MQVVILAGGIGKRLRPITETVPKPLVPALGRPVIEYALERLPDAVTEIVFVVGYKGDMMRAQYGSSAFGRSVQYVVQEKPLGTAHAIQCAASVVHAPFLMLYGDGIYGTAGLEKLLRHEYALLAHRVEHPEHFGVLVVRPDGTLERTVEKPTEFVSDLTWVGAAVLQPEFFTVGVPLSPRGEYEATDVFNTLITRGRTFHVEHTDLWLTANTIDEVAAVEAGLRAQA